MDYSKSSEGFPLQPYDGDTSSVPRSTPLLTVRKKATTGDAHLHYVELRFLQVVGRNKIPILQPKDLQLESSDAFEGSSPSRSGFTMEVHRGQWNGQAVAVKQLRRRPPNGQDDPLVDSERYQLAVFDLLFELQIMSKPSLRDHRNITALLAVSFDSGVAAKPDPDTSVDSEDLFILPTLVVELADVRFPDLSLFLNPEHNPNLPKHLPYETSAALIADIADGVDALHRHDVVHADLKPQNILIFPTDDSPCGLVAKISDFGFSGMATYNFRGQRGWLSDSVPRGGTAEWNAPECIAERIILPVGFSRSEEPQDMPGRDIYSFGLLSTYIALAGQSPKSYVKNLQDVKLANGMIEAVKARLKRHYSDAASENPSLGKIMEVIADMTLSLDCDARAKSLDNIRPMLFGSNAYEQNQPKTELFVLDFNLFPSTAHEFRCSGLQAAYWQSPPQFRTRVFDCFRSVSSGIFGQYVPSEIWHCLREKENE